MYATLLAKISTTLDSVTNVKDHFSIPKTKLTKFPCVFYKPLGFVNTFETQNENQAVYRFLMIVMVSAEGTNNTLENAFNTVLPNTVDAIIAQINADWNQGTIDGHRVTAKVESADAWEVSEEQDGIICYAPLQIEVRLLTSN